MLNIPLLIASHAKVPPDGIQIKANDASFEAWIKEVQPAGIVFDRFLMEEYYGSRIRAVDPSILRVLDAQDLHFLRYHRSLQLSLVSLPAKQMALKLVHWQHPRLFREWTAIRRSHLTLVLSSYELDLLKHLEVPESLLHLDGFHTQTPSPETDASSGAVWIGNFRHAPNRDAVLYLKHTLWPKVRDICPDATVTLFGSYPDKAAMALHDPTQGFYMQGPAKTLNQVFQKARLNLAPLRFGAGIKGKIFEGWRYGVPALASPIAAEGMGESSNWGGIIASCEKSFAEGFRTLWNKDHSWSESQTNGYRILQTHFGPQLRSKLSAVLQSLSIPKGDLIADILHWSKHDRSRYFSKWLEEKNRP
jgi:O-antigen biosynthesis protein